MSYALDTNILARSIEPDHPMHAQTLAALDKLLRSGAEVCVLAQTLYEFWVVATRPREQNGLGLNAAEAQAHLAKFESVFRVKMDDAAVYAIWRQLVKQHAVLGKNAHDARIAAAMSHHGISHLVTFNKDHFKRFSQITALLPSEV